MAATGWWPPTGGCSLSVTRPSKGRCPGCPCTPSGTALLPTETGAGYLIVTTDGRAVGFGDSPQFGDVADAVAGWSGRLVGGALVAG